MTSFWFLILMVIASYIIVVNREYLYLIHLGTLFIFTNLNGSKHPFIICLPRLFLHIKFKITGIERHARRNAMKSDGAWYSTVGFKIFNFAFPSLSALVECVDQGKARKRPRSDDPMNVSSSSQTAGSIVRTFKKLRFPIEINNIWNASCVTPPPHIDKERNHVPRIGGKSNSHGSTSSTMWLA